jgi:hypothetical protein
MVQWVNRLARVVFVALLVAIAVVVALGVLYGMAKKHSVSIVTLTVSTLPSADAVPVADSKLGAAAMVLSNMFAPPSSTRLESKVVYNGDSAMICVRIKAESSWHNTVQCIEGANPLPNSPLTMGDRIGGPSIYFFFSRLLSLWNRLRSPKR